MFTLRRHKLLPPTIYSALLSASPNATGLTASAKATAVRRSFTRRRKPCATNSAGALSGYWLAFSHIDQPTCTVVIPTFNELETLPLLVNQLMAIPGVRVLVVDDASPDGTGEIANGLASAFPGRVDVLHRAGRGGLGSAYIEGMQRALTHGSALIAQMDADLSHDVRYLPELIAAAADADLVIGSRYVPGGGVENWSLLRELLSRFANLYVRWVTGLPVKDGTAGYRCWRRETLMQLPLSKLVSNGYAFQVEMAWETYQRRLRIKEVPIVFVERRHGRSKLNWFVVFESMLVPWKLRRR